MVVVCILTILNFEQKTSHGLNDEYELL